MMHLVMTKAELDRLIRDRSRDREDAYLRGPNANGEYSAYFTMNHYDLTIPIKVEG